MTNRTNKAAAAAVLALALAGCGSPWEGTGLDEWGWYACDDFGSAMTGAGGAQAAYALGEPGRQTFVASMGESVSRTATADVEAAYEVLVRTVDGPEATWRLGMDTFAARCQALGWQPV